jgi:hypothetical protein
LSRFIIFAKLNLNQLYSGCEHRTEEFYNNNKSYMLTKNKIKEDIKNNGIKYPLCVINEKDNDHYKVEVGNQRLEALKELDYKHNIPCLIYCREGQTNLPINYINVPRDCKVIAKDYFNGYIKRCVIDEENMIIMSHDNDRWDPEVIYSKHKRPEIIRNTKLSI